MTRKYFWCVLPNNLCQWPPKNSPATVDRWGHRYVTNVCSFTTTACLPADCSDANPFFHSTPPGCKPWTPIAYYGVAIQYWGNTQQCPPGGATKLPKAQQCQNPLIGEAECCTAACEVLGIAMPDEPAVWTSIAKSAMISVPGPKKGDPSTLTSIGPGVNVTFKGVNAAPDDPNSGDCARDTRTGMVTDRYTHMLFTCDENAQDAYLHDVWEDETSKCHYNVWFKTAQACESDHEPDPAGGGGSGLSSGSVFLIVFFVGFVGVYLVGGAAYHNFQYGTWQVPHARQWGEFFQLAREGVSFAARGFSHGGGGGGGDYSSGHVGGVQASDNYAAPAPTNPLAMAKEGQAETRVGYADL